MKNDRLIKDFVNKYGLNCTYKIVNFDDCKYEGIVTLGRTHFDKRLIEISSKLSPDDALQTFCHEFAHIIFGKNFGQFRSTVHNTCFLCYELVLLCEAFEIKNDCKAFDIHIAYVKQNPSIYVDLFFDYATACRIIWQMWQLDSRLDMFSRLEHCRSFVLKECSNQSYYACNLAFLTSENIHKEIERQKR